MQQSVSVNLETAHSLYRRPICVFLGVCSIIGTIFIFGCSDDKRYSAQISSSFTGVSISLHCPDKAFADVISPAAQSWADRTGARLAIKIEPMSVGDEADVGIIDAPEFGSWAARDALTLVPPGLRAADHPFQWMGLLPAYREQLIVWGGQAQAIPLSGDGFVIVYRLDRLREPKFIDEFKKQFSRNPVAPTSWEEFAAIAGIFATIDGKPSLPPLTNTELASLFFRIAACADRRVQIESPSTKVSGGLDALSFQFDLTNGKPRLNAPAFSTSAEWLANLVAKKCLPPPTAAGASDPATALAKNQASIAVMSLAQLARMPRENGAIPERFGLAALPGTQTTYDPEKQRLISLQNANYIPYFAGGRLGVVRSRCQNPDAAFDLLAELGGPTRSMEVISSSELGAGPFRIAHLDHDRLQLWYGYGFDSLRSDQLRNALLQYVNLEAKNPAYGLRGPDQAALYSAASAAIGKIAAGTPAEAGLKQLLDDWKQIDAKTPEETRLRWRKLAAGLN
jgi:multiple sugar transport system substrate-binding protein